MPPMRSQAAVLPTPLGIVGGGLTDAWHSARGGGGGGVSGVAVHTCGDLDFPKLDRQGIKQKDRLRT